MMFFLESICYDLIELDLVLGVYGVEMCIILRDLLFLITGI